MWGLTVCFVPLSGLAECLCPFVSMLVQEADRHRCYPGLNIDWRLGIEVSAGSGGTVRNDRQLPILGVH